MARTTSTLLLLVLGLLAVSLIDAHSWLACSDYRGDINYYDPSKCYAYPRGWKSVNSNTFGEDRGYNYQGMGSFSINT